MRPESRYSSSSASGRSSHDMRVWGPLTSPSAPRNVTVAPRFKAGQRVRARLRGPAEGAAAAPDASIRKTTIRNALAAFAVALAAISGAHAQEAAYAFDVGNIGFANTWLALGSFAGAAGWVMLTSGAWPQWLGWWGAVAGFGMLLVSSFAGERFRARSLSLAPPPGHPDTRFKAD